MDVLKEFLEVRHQMQGKLHDDQIDGMFAWLAHVVLACGLYDPALERKGVNHNHPTFFSHFCCFLNQLVGI